MRTLESLPPEILFTILSFSSPFSCTKDGEKHTLETIAATSDFLHSIVEEYTRGLLKQYAGLAPKRAYPQGYHKKWLKWITNACQMCLKKTQRRAIFDPTSPCCMKCDRKYFPKMTMTTAMGEHGLSKFDLFTPNILHPTLPPLAFGQYNCMGSRTIMISEPDVLARKKYIYGLLREPDNDDKIVMRHRCATHRRIADTADITFYNGQWVAMRTFRRVNSPAPKGDIPSFEYRSRWVKKQLEREWAAMGITGRCAEITFDDDMQGFTVNTLEPSTVFDD